MAVTFIPATETWVVMTNDYQWSDVVFRNDTDVGLWVAARSLLLHTARGQTAVDVPLDYVAPGEHCAVTFHVSVAPKAIFRCRTRHEPLQSLMSCNLDFWDRRPILRRARPPTHSHQCLLNISLPFGAGETFTVFVRLETTTW